MNPASYPPLIPYSTGSSSSSSSSSSYDRTANAHENSIFMERRVKRGRVGMKTSLASPADFSVLVPTMTSYLTWKDHLRFALTSHSWKHALLPVPSKLDDGSVNLCSLSNIVCKISHLNLTVLAAYFKMSKISAIDIDRCNISLLFKRCISLSRLDISLPPLDIFLSHSPALGDLAKSLARAISRQFFPICQVLRPSTLIDLGWLTETNMRSIRESIGAHKDENVLERVDRAYVSENLAPISLILDYLSCFPRLHHLNFTCEQLDLTKPFMQLANAYPFLTSLSLTTPNIEGNVLGPYMKMTKLRSLELISHALTDTCLVSLSKHVEELESFKLFRSFNDISTAGIQTFLSQCKNLQHLTLEDEDREDDDPTLNWDQILQTVATSCPKLEFVRLQDRGEEISLISFESLNSLKKNCPNLKELHLQGIRISEINLEASIEILSQLESITLIVGETFTIRDAYRFLQKYINSSKQKSITFNLLSTYDKWSWESYNFGALSNREEQGTFCELVTLLCHPCLKIDKHTCDKLLRYLIDNVFNINDETRHSIVESFIENSLKLTPFFEDRFTHFKNTHGDLIANAYRMLINQYKHLQDFNSFS